MKIKLLLFSFIMCSSFFVYSEDDVKNNQKVIASWQLYEIGSKIDSVLRQLEIMSNYRSKLVAGVQEGPYPCDVRFIYDKLAEVENALGEVGQRINKLTDFQEAHGFEPSNEAVMNKYNQAVSTVSELRSTFPSR